MNAVATTHVAANTTATRLAVMRNEQPRTVVLLANPMKRNPQATAAYTQCERTIGRIVRQTLPILASRSNHPNLVSTRVTSGMMTSISRNEAAAGAAAQVAVTATWLKAMPISTMTLLIAKTITRSPRKGLGNVYARARERRPKRGARKLR